LAALRVSAAPSPRPKHRYIDIHTHLGAFRFGQNVSVKGLLNWMDEHDVERAVIQPLVSPEAAPTLQPMQTSDAALEAAKAHPDRLIAFCCLDPRVTVDPPANKTYPERQGHVAGVNGLIEILKRYKDAGARGLGEHKVGLPFDHPQMMQLYEACDALELPILFHLDDLRGIDTVGLPRLENVLKTFPKLPLIGHACGFWSSISGEATPEDFGRYPKVPRPITPGGALDRLMDGYPNLYGDLSGPGGAIALTRDPEFAREFILRRADRLLFGSDYLAPGQQIPQFDILAAMNMPDEVQYKIHRGNAIRLLKLAGR
jgi:predicted TIM-barrel fold metal-dependent hydrolase